MERPLALAVIGSGVAGVVASFLLGRKHQVTLFESESTIGGHTHTVTVPSGPDAGLAVDTGFIVLNDRTYPLFSTFLSRLSVPVRRSEMSFSLYDETTGFCYAGRGLSGLFTDPRNIVRPRFYRFLGEILRFFREGRAALAVDDGAALRGMTLAQYVAARGYSQQMIDEYLVPMTAAIWSASNDDVSVFPMAPLLRFFRHHGLLALSNRPQWQTVVGGSAQYLRAFERSFTGSIRRGTPIRAIRRDAGHVELSTASGTERFDGAVIATHADQASRLLADPTLAENRLLGLWKYQRNVGWLHTDRSFLPPSERAWASWNYRRAGPRTGATTARGGVSITYAMNRLQGLDSAAQYCVTLGSDRRPRDETIIENLDFLHPIFTNDALETQPLLPSLNGVNRTWFCGSYFGYGFHEDAVRSAVEVGRCFGVEL